MDINALYAELLNNFIAGTTFRKKGAVLFFLGFPGIFYQSLNNSGIPSLTGKSLHDHTGYCDYRKIDAAEEIDAIQRSEGIRWAYYEELIAIADAPGEQFSYKGDIIVVKNNIFDKYYPIEVSGGPKIKSDLFSDSNITKYIQT